jgi:hypothetical protein
MISIPLSKSGFNKKGAMHPGSLPGARLCKEGSIEELESLTRDAVSLEDDLAIGIDIRQAGVIKSSPAAIV